MTLVGGSLPERSKGKLYNTCCVFSKQGELLARHRCGWQSVQGMEEACLARKGLAKRLGRGMPVTRLSLMKGWWLQGAGAVQHPG